VYGGSHPTVSNLPGHERRVQARLRRLSGSLRSALATPREPQLERISVTVAPSGGERQEVTVQIGLVTWLRETSNGPVHVVRAPEVPSLELAVLPSR